MHNLILHSYRRCPFAIRVRMVLEEKGAAYELVEESLREPSAALLRLHPEGKVPLLRHGESVIFESAVITEYLDEVLPGPSFLPATPLAKAEMRLWTYWCQNIFKADLDAFKYKRPEDPAELIARLKNHLRKIETERKGEYLLGDHFSLADIHVFPFVRQLSKTEGVDFIPAPVQAWLNSILDRPSFGRVMEKRA